MEEAEEHGLPLTVKEDEFYKPHSHVFKAVRNC